MSGNVPTHLVDLGLLPIHRASLDGNLEHIQELCETSNVDAPVIPRIQQPPNELLWPNGETPLMLAALMGHMDIFEYLIQKGADCEAEDGDGFPIRFYCTAQKFITDKKAFWARKGVGKEHTKARYTRPAIVDLLGNPARLSILRSNTGAEYPGVYLGKEGTKIKLFVNIETLDIGEPLGPVKTIGCIKAREGHQVLKVAVSGFKDRSNPFRRDPRVLDREVWNDIALHKVAQIIGFPFSANFHDNGNRVPLPHHLGRVQAGHVEVQLATWYVIEMADRLAANQKTAGGYNGPWSTRRKLRNLKARVALLGSDSEAVIYLNSHPCISCHKFVYALKNWTGIRFDVRGGLGVGPMVRSKTGRRNTAIDLVLEEFEDLDAAPDPSDDEDEDEDEDERQSDIIVPSSVPRPGVANSDDRTVPVTPAPTTPAPMNNTQESIIINDDSTIDNDSTGEEWEVEEAEESWESDAGSAMEQTPIQAYAATPGAERPMPEFDSQPLYTPLAFMPQPQNPTTVEAFRDRIGAYKHVPGPRGPMAPAPPAGARYYGRQRPTPRFRTYEERMRYRNPWPAPVFVPPEYLEAYYRDHQG